MPRFVTVETRGEVALVWVDRPPANALDLELLAEGHAAQEELRQGEPGAVVIVGRDGFFSAGVADGFAALPRAAYPRVKEQLRGETVGALRRVVEAGADPMLGEWVGEETAAASAAILRRD